MTSHLRIESPSDSQLMSPGNETGKAEAMREGRNWKIMGAVMIVGGGLIALVSILAIAALCTDLGNSVANIGEGSRKLISFMVAHSNHFIIAGLGGAALGGLFMLTGVVSIFHGKHIQRRAQRASPHEE